MATLTRTESTTSLAYTDLPTVGPTLPVVIPGSGRLFVSLTASAIGNASSTACFMSFAGAGTNNITATDANALVLAGSAQQRASATAVLIGLNAGNTTLTAKYKVSGGGAASCTFANRSIMAIPLP